MVVEYHNQTTENVDQVEILIDSIFETIEETKNMQVIFVTNDEIKEINKTYRDKDYATDVISFPNDEDPESFGDIFISLEKAREQAASYGHSFDREVGFLAVHGYLHLKGYDHHTPEEEKEMFTLQEEILQRANLKRG
ncbi:rRNA maturation RNase YbeY [Acholeplasma equirhinis]|uniref:rRNA maturation RNase YbeY n=1 Tax=Acholeplasma equirhinis TaxID=555393 RepID=UPI00197B00AA|nr:rRNA maturation RNase YbeY [Acholeplasma equirhinis]MBN3490063.1 rRNA maturation RNase YbeY [Acholeplasma equirhinis]